MQQSTAVSWVLGRTRSVAQLPIAVVVATLLLSSLVGGTATARAQEQSVLLHALQDGRDFRVRTQAAFALGRTHDVHFAAALERALHDRHPIVRAAAASALGALASPASLPALRVAAHDADPAVAEQARAAVALLDHSSPDAPMKLSAADGGAAAHVLDKARYAIVLGTMHNESGFAGPELARVLADSLQRELSALHRVAVLSTTDVAQLALAQQRALPVLRLEGNVVQITRERTDDQVSVHCELSLLVMDQGQRNLRSVLKGAATGLEPSMGPRVAQEKRLARKAVDGAVRSALRNASSAIENAAASVDVHGTDTATASLPEPAPHVR